MTTTHLDGRRLEELLDGLEEAGRRRMVQEGIGYDLSWLRKELGLVRTERRSPGPLGIGSEGLGR